MTKWCANISRPAPAILIQHRNGITSDPGTGCGVRRSAGAAWLLGCQSDVLCGTGFRPLNRREHGGIVRKSAVGITTQPAFPLLCLSQPFQVRLGNDLNTFSLQ